MYIPVNSSPQQFFSTNFYGFSCIPSFFINYLYTIWLFTYSDIKTIIIPKTVFGALSALATTSFGFAASTTPTTSEVLRRTPLTLFWVWINLLPFAIANQRHPSSIKEDAINKPWRVMPSRRMSQPHARRLMFCLYGLAAAVSWRIGGFVQCVTLMGLGFWYNEIGGSDNNCIIRNLINGLGYNCFASGATEVTLGFSLLPYETILPIVTEVNNPGQHGCLLFWKWIAWLVAVVSTTAHAQDMHDQGGDSIRGRRTVPLVIGDLHARISIVIGVAFWTSTCCMFWTAGWLPCIAIGTLASVVSARTCLLRTVKADKMTFVLWNAWITGVYMLPVLKLWF